jgi:hypothetical protein
VIYEVVDVETDDQTPGGNSVRVHPLLVLAAPKAEGEQPVVQLGVSGAQALAQAVQRLVESQDLIGVVLVDEARRAT